MQEQKNQKTVAISIVTWNSEGEIRDCLQSVSHLGPNWEVWVVDNNSSDGTVEIIRNEFGFVKLIANKDNRGFAAANNQIIDASKTDYVLLLNPDTIAGKDELQKLLDMIEETPKVGILGPQLHDGNGEIQVICDYFPYPWLNFIEAMGLYRFCSDQWKCQNLLGTFFDHKSDRKVEWFVGACMLVRREAIERAGNIPEDYFMFAEAMHWCFLMWQSGYEVAYTSKARIIHKKNRSARQLPPLWRIEKSTLCKYVFCYGQFGWLKTKFIVLTDFLSYTFGIWRLMFTKPEPEESKYWKLGRKVIWDALWMSPNETSKRQLKT